MFFDPRVGEVFMSKPAVKCRPGELWLSKVFKTYIFHVGCLLNRFFSLCQSFVLLRNQEISSVEIIICKKSSDENGAKCLSSGSRTRFCVFLNNAQIKLTHLETHSNHGIIQVHFGGKQLRLTFDFCDQLQLCFKFNCVKFTSNQHSKNLRSSSCHSEEICSSELHDLKRKNLIEINFSLILRFDLRF